MSENNELQDQLLALLHPARIRGSSDMMYYIISSILGAGWVENPRGVGSFSITSDGFVVDCGLFIGAYSDFIRNVRGYVSAADLNESQSDLFWSLYHSRVSDHRL